MDRFFLLFNILRNEIKLSNILTYLLLFATFSAFIPEFISNLLNLPQETKAILRMIFSYALSTALSFLTFYLFITCSHFIDLYKKNITFFFAIFILFMSVILNNNYLSLILLFSVVCSLLFYELLPKIQVEANLSPTIYFLIFLVAIPLVLSILLTDNSRLYISESYRGLQNSRNDFGFLCGFLLLLIFISKNNSFIVYLFIPLVIISFNLTASRTCFLAVTISSIFLIFSYIRLRELKRLFIICFSLIFIWIPSQQWNPLVDKNRVYRSINLVEPFSNNLANHGIFHISSERIMIFNKTIDAITDNFWFGRGNFYQQITLNNKIIEPHNFFLQSILNFGLFATLIWCLLLLKYFLHISYKGRALILFMILYAQFQPGFDAFFFAPSVIAIFIASFNPKIKLA